MKTKWKEVVFIVFAAFILINLTSCNYAKKQKSEVTLEVTLIDKGKVSVLLQDSEGNLYSISKETLEEYLDFDALLEKQIITVHYSGGLQECYPYTFVRIYDIETGN